MAGTVLETYIKIRQLIEERNFRSAQISIESAEYLDLYRIVKDFAAEGNIEALDFLMNKCSNYNNSLIHTCLLNDRGEIVLNNDILYLAIKNNKLEALDLILSSKMYKNYPQNFKSSHALVEASKNDNLEAVKSLLQKASDLNLNVQYRSFYTSDNGKTSIGFAIQNSNLEMFNILQEAYISKGLQEKVTQEINSALYYPTHYSVEMFDFLFSKSTAKEGFLFKTFQQTIKTSSQNQIEVLKHILEISTGFLDEKPTYNNTSLAELYLEQIVTSGNSNNTDILDILIDKKPDLTRSAFSQKALIIATEKASMGIVETLINKGFSKYVTDDQGNTPLMIAAKAGNIAIASSLLSLGRTENDQYSDVQNNNGETALFLAARNGRNEIVKLLIEDGADPDCHNASGITPLFLATHYNNTELANILLQDVSLINLEINHNGVTPLIYAIQYRYPTIAELLISKGANIEATNLQGNSALTMAIGNRLFYLADSLIENGANIQPGDLTLAYRGGNLELVQKINARGVELDLSNGDVLRDCMNIFSDTGNPGLIKYFIMHYEINDYSWIKEAINTNYSTHSYRICSHERLDLLNHINCLENKHDISEIFDKFLQPKFPSYILNRGLNPMQILFHTIEDEEEMGEVEHTQTPIERGEAEGMSTELLIALGMASAEGTE